MIPANPGYSANDYRNLVSRLLVLQNQAAGAMSGRPAGHGVGPMAGAVVPVGDLPAPDLTLPRQPTPAAAGTPPLAPALRSPTELMNAPVRDASAPPVPATAATSPPPAPAAAPVLGGAAPVTPSYEQPVDGAGAAGATVGFSGGTMAGDQGSSGTGAGSGK